MVWGLLPARCAANPKASLSAGSTVRACPVHRHCGSGGWGLFSARHAASTRLGTAGLCCTHQGQQRQPSLGAVLPALEPDQTLTKQRELAYMFEGLVCAAQGGCAAEQLGCCYKEAPAQLHLVCACATVWQLTACSACLQLCADGGQPRGAQPCCAPRQVLRACRSQNEAAAPSPTQPASAAAARHQGGRS